MDTFILKNKINDQVEIFDGEVMLNFKQHTWHACLRVRKTPKDTET